LAIKETTDWHGMRERTGERERSNERRSLTSLLECIPSYFSSTHFQTIPLLLLLASAIDPQERARHFIAHDNFRNGRLRHAKKGEKGREERSKEVDDVRRSICQK